MFSHLHKISVGSLFSFHLLDQLILRDFLTYEFPVLQGSKIDHLFLFVWPGLIQPPLGLVFHVVYALHPEALTSQICVRQHTVAVIVIL